jgi:hypothetical protein
MNNKTKPHLPLRLPPDCTKYCLTARVAPRLTVAQSTRRTSCRRVTSLFI